MSTWNEIVKVQNNVAQISSNLANLAKMQEKSEWELRAWFSCPIPPELIAPIASMLRGHFEAQLKRQRAELEKLCHEFKIEDGEGGGK